MRDPVRTTRVSSSGLAMPETAFMAMIDSRIEAAGTASARSAHRMRNCPRS